MTRFETLGARRLRSPSHPHICTQPIRRGASSSTSGLIPARMRTFSFTDKNGIQVVFKRTPFSFTIILGEETLTKMMITSYALDMDTLKITYKSEFLGEMEIGSGSYLQKTDEWETMLRFFSSKLNEGITSIEEKISSSAATKKTNEVIRKFEKALIWLKDINILINKLGR